MDEYNYINVVIKYLSKIKKISFNQVSLVQSPQVFDKVIDSEDLILPPVTQIGSSSHLCFSQVCSVVPQSHSFRNHGEETREREGEEGQRCSCAASSNATGTIQCGSVSTAGDGRL